MRFATDASLGKLGRHLRAAGFDTLCQHQCSHAGFFEGLDADRIILTRTATVKKRFQRRRLIFIPDNDPWEQLLHVVREAPIRHEQMKPFSRCLACNMIVSPIDSAAVKTRVPAYVWQHQQRFYECRRCRRIYWRGSHHDRLFIKLATLFRQKEEQIHGC
jgi:uncharacterized protein with PIN domain